MKKKKTRVDADITLLFLKKYSDKVVRLLGNTPVTPVHISVVSFVLFAPLVAYLFFIGGYVNNMLALIILVVHSFLDLMDGELARYKNLSSRLGIWLELSLDPLIQTLVILSISLNILIHYPSDFKYLVFLVILGQSYANILGTMLWAKFKLDPFVGNKAFTDIAKSTHLLDFFLKNIIVPTHPIFGLFFTMRFLLIIGIITDRVPLAFFTFGIFITIRATVIFFVLSYYYAGSMKIQKYKVFQYLKHSEIKV